MSPLPPRSSAPLLLCLVASFALYLLLAFWFPLLAHYRQAPLADIRTFTPTLATGLLYGLLLVVLFILHWRACREVGRLAIPLPLRAILLAALLLSLPLLLTFPMNATDVYRYVIRGRISSLYGESPYLTPPERFATDPFLPLAGEWAGETSPYGPLWEGVAAGVTGFSGENLLLGIVLFKILGLACFLGIGVLLWYLSPAYLPALSVPRARLSVVALWAWNPFLLLIFVTNAHNDALMVFWLLLGLLLTRRGWSVLGFLVMVLAPLTKPIALLALPLFFLAIWRERQDNRQRLRFASLALGGGLLIGILAFVPWASAGSEPATLNSTLTTTFGLATRLIREATSGSGFAPATLFWFGAQLLSGSPMSLSAIGTAAQAIFILFCLWLLWQTWRGRAAEQSTAEIFIAYLLQALNFRIWYAAWPFPWLLLDGVRRPYWLYVGLFFLLTSQLSVIIYGHIRVYLLGGEHALAHLIAVPFTFLLPLLLARLQPNLLYSIPRAQLFE